MEFYYQVLYLLQSVETHPAEEPNILIKEYHMTTAILFSANQNAHISTS